MGEAVVGLSVGSSGAASFYKVPNSAGTSDFLVREAAPTSSMIRIFLRHDRGVEKRFSGFGWGGRSPIHTLNLVLQP